MKEIDIMLICLVCLVAGFVFGEYKQCDDMNMSYSFEYGRCYVEK